MRPSYARGAPKATARRSMSLTRLKRETTCLCQTDRHVGRTANPRGRAGAGDGAPPCGEGSPEGSRKADRAPRRSATTVRAVFLTLPALPADVGLRPSPRRRRAYGPAVDDALRAPCAQPDGQAGDGMKPPPPTCPRGCTHFAHGSPPKEHHQQSAIGRNKQESENTAQRALILIGCFPTCAAEHPMRGFAHLSGAPAWTS